MPRDRRRGRRPHRPGATAPKQQSPQPGAVPRQAPVQKTTPIAKVPPIRQPMVGNPHLVKDIRNIAMVAAALAVLLVVLSIVIR